MSNVIGIKGAHEAPRNRRSSMETMIISPAIVERWLDPPFQRPKRINSKVKMLAEEIRQDGVSIPGVITLGRLGNAGALYLVDGQHRLEAFRISELPEAIADVRIVQYDTMGEMADAFGDLNTALAKMKPDDILRAMESTSPMLKRITSECPFVTYGQVRRGDDASPLLSMSQTIRSWAGSAGDTPTANTTGRTAALIIREDMDDTSVGQLIRFLHLAHQAWGRDKEYYRLWGALNLTVCMWLYRQLVLDRTRGIKRHVTLSETQFRQCMQALSAESTFVDWLHRRHLSDRDRSPAYSRMRKIFTARMRSDGMVKPMMPAPSWVKD